MYQNILGSLRRKAYEMHIPFDGMFELTSRCNLKCRFCYVCDRSIICMGRQEKTTSEWLDIIKDARDAGMLECSFTGGEPFLREDFEEIYCKSYDMGLRISIFTNAALIGKRQLSYLSKRKPDLMSITIYGASELSYQTVCGSGNSFNHVIAAIERLHSSGLPIELKTLALKPLIEEYDLLGQIASKYTNKVRFEAYLGSGRDDPNRMYFDWRIPLSQLSSLKHEFYKWSENINDKQSQPSQLIVSRDARAIPCNAGKSGFTITYDGRMLGCPALTCFEAYPFDEGFISAWDSLICKMQKALSCIECLECSEYYSCFKCPAYRLKETGSISNCSKYLHELASTNDKTQNYDS